MIATALVHGNRAPHCFSVSFAEYIVYGKVKSNPDPKDIPDHAIQEKILKVHKIYHGGLLTFQRGKFCRQFN